MAKKQCSRGWGCGDSCISRTKTCKSNLDDQGKQLVEGFTEMMLRITERKPEPQQEENTEDTEQTDSKKMSTEERREQVKKLVDALFQLASEE